MSTSVLGRPVTGEISHYRASRYEQKPGEEFLALLDAVLDLDNVEAVRWNQNTPSFNDGDPCVFGTGEVYVKLVGGDPAAGDYEDGFENSFQEYHYETRSYSPMKEEHVAVDAALTALGREMNHFNDFLEESFGDPAEITATKSGFSVEYYDGDY